MFKGDRGSPHGYRIERKKEWPHETKPATRVNSRRIRHPMDMGPGATAAKEGSVKAEVRRVRNAKRSGCSQSVSMNTYIPVAKTHQRHVNLKRCRPGEVPAKAVLTSLEIALLASPCLTPNGLTVVENAPVSFKSIFLFQVIIGGWPGEEHEVGREHKIVNDGGVGGRRGRCRERGRRRWKCWQFVN